MLNAEQLATMMEQNVLGKFPEVELVGGGSREFYLAISKAIVDHFHQGAAVVIPDPSAEGQFHAPGSVI